MGVEVRQMVIKSTVQREPDEDEKNPVAPDLGELKAEVLSECRQLILDTLRERRER